MVISTFSTLGIPKVIIRFFSAMKAKGQLLFLSFLTTFFGFLLVTFVYIVFKDSILDFINASSLLKDHFLFILLLVFFISFYDVISAISNVYLNSVTPIFLNEIFLKSYCMVILILHGFKILDFNVFLQLFTTGFILRLLILFIIQWKNKRLSINLGIDSVNFKEIISFGLFVFASGASLVLVSRLDMIMIGMLLDLEHVAFYTVAFFIGNAIKVPGRAVISISAPLLVKAWEKKDFHEIQTIYSKSSINQLIIGGVLFLCLWLNIDNLLTMLPEKFSHGKWVVFFIGLSQLFNITTGVNGAIIVNSKYYRYDLSTNFLLIFITILTNYFFIRICEYGINGAALATAISVLIFNLIRLLIIKIKLNMHPFSRNTVYAIILLFATYQIVSLFPKIENIYIDILFRTILVGVLFIPIMFRFKLSEDINNIFSDFWKRYLK
jgi:O-antigen/teichoic acid export membrane protein